MINHIYHMRCSLKDKNTEVYFMPLEGPIVSEELLGVWLSWLEERSELSQPEGSVRVLPEQNAQSHDTATMETEGSIDLKQEHIYLLLKPPQNLCFSPCAL